jgi:AcrR family transcriptional regulator
MRRRVAETRDAVVAVALELFDSRGFGGVTMDDIARAAGVSRRTLYRRFPTKEHIVLEVPKRWLKVWDAAVAARPDGPPRAVAETACLAVSRYIDAHRFEVLAAYRALADVPALASASAATDEWTDRVVDLLRREPVALPGPTAHIIAGAYLGAIDAMMAHWVKGGGRPSVLRQTRALLDRLRPIWPG